MFQLSFIKADTTITMFLHITDNPGFPNSYMVEKLKRSDDLPYLFSCLQIPFAYPNQHTMC